MSKGKIAIYMCCYNHEKFVAEAIESILNQTYSNWKFWIVNGALILISEDIGIR